MTSRRRLAVLCIAGLALASCGVRATDADPSPTRATSTTVSTDESTTPGQSTTTTFLSDDETGDLVIDSWMEAGLTRAQAQCLADRSVGADPGDLSSLGDLIDECNIDLSQLGN